MNNVAAELKHLYELAQREPAKRFTKLWKSIINPLWLAQAWEEIRRNKGRQTPGVNGKTAEDVDLDLIHTIAKELKDGSYRPTPVRRVYIPKANGKTRPLGIPSVQDKIVQQALRMVLEAIFEADFLKCSHGFRQGLSTHTALRDVVRSYPRASWIIESDIEGCYDNFAHEKLVCFIRERIADEKVVNLIRKFLEAGYMEDWKFHRTFSGVPQGSVISPVLANIFLHQLDKFMVHELGANRALTSKEIAAQINPEYRKFTNKITRLKKKLKETGDRAVITEIQELKQQRKSVSCYRKERTDPCKAKYTRYADDSVILVYGTKAEAETIKDKVAEKLSELGLKLSQEKTKLTHWNKPVLFLGYEIKGILRETGVGIRARLAIPPGKLKKAVDAIKKVCGYHQIPEADVLLQVSAQYRGICNYYKYATAPQGDFSRLASETWWAYAHYLARRHKCSIRQVIKQEKRAGKYGSVNKNGRCRKTFQCQIGTRTITLDIFPPGTELIHRIQSRPDWKVDLKPIMPLNWQSGRSYATRLTALERSRGVCEVCHNQPVVYVHHTKPIGKRSFKARIMSDHSQRESAIAVCEECHLKRHQGKYKPGKQRHRVGEPCAVNTACTVRGGLGGDVQFVKL